MASSPILENPGWGSFRLPLGEGAARRRRMRGGTRVGPCTRPTPGSARSTLSWERVFYPHKNIPKAEAFGTFSIYMYLTLYRLPHTLG